MSQYTSLVEKAADQYLAAVAKAQDAVVGAASVVGKATARLPQPPLPEGVPTPNEVIDLGFGFAEKLLAQNKAYAKRLTAAYLPQPHRTTTTRPSTAKSA